MANQPTERSTDDEPFDIERAPLDRPPGFEHDWGGDGSDLSRPVRAHVLAALRPSSAPYPDPVSRLITLGDPGAPGIEERRRGLDLRQQHLPDLLRMARDRGLYTADGDTDEVWAPLHALRALGDLELADDVAEIIPLFDLEDDWNDTALTDLLAKVGAPALEPLRAYLADRNRWGFGHSSAADVLAEIAKRHPELRDQAVETLSDMLRDAEHYHEDSVTGAMGGLIDLRATEALPLIRHAFEIGKIDETAYGAWDDVLDELGVEPDEDDPLIEESRQRFEERQEREFPRARREEILAALEQFKARNRAQALAAPAASPLAPARDPRRATQERARKQKNKRKAQSAARKANRRKHK